MSARRVVRTSDMKEMTSTMYALIIRVTSHAADEPTGSVLPHRLIRPRGRPQEARGTGEGARETSRRPPRRRWDRRVYPPSGSGSRGAGAGGPQGRQDAAPDSELDSLVQQRKGVKLNTVR